MSIFVDTSCLYAVLDGDDENHREASKIWRELLAQDEPLVTTNYVVVETMVLVQARLGLRALQVLVHDVIPALTIEWIGEADHTTGVAAVLSGGKRRLTLVDCVSFHVMGRLGIKRCLAIDVHFKDYGYDCVP
jgi:uncharacterized protein